jgi:hypothetical protein
VHASGVHSKATLKGHNILVLSNRIAHKMKAAEEFLSKCEYFPVLSRPVTFPFLEICCPNLVMFSLSHCLDSVIGLSQTVNTTVWAVFPFLDDCLACLWPVWQTAITVPDCPMNCLGLSPESPNHCPGLSGTVWDSILLCLYTVSALSQTVLTV